MTDAEQRAVLEAIARDEDAYPRDRIAAVKALQGMGRRATTNSRGASEVEHR